MDVDDKMSLVARPPLSQNGRRLAEKFICLSGGGDVVQDGARRWTRQETMDHFATELIDLHRCSQTLEQTPWGDLDIGEEKSISIISSQHDSDSNRTVKHLGQGVFVQSNTLGIDPDSRMGPKTITTEETRKFAMKCLDATLTHLPLVVGTGQQRIGKTRGIMAYTLQELLWRGEAVMRVSYKDNQAYLFFPQSDGSYKVWNGVARNWNDSDLATQEAMFVLLDPPESHKYDRAARCHVIEYCSNNEERHTKNVSKDGQLLITDVPHLDEVLCMTSVLWDDKNSPICIKTKEGDPILVQEFHSNEEKEEELSRRCALVGCIPGIVFKADNFMDALNEIKANSAEECRKSSLGHMIHFYKQGKVGANKDLVSAMSHYFLVNAKDQKRRLAVIRLNEATSYYVQEQLREKLSDMTGSHAFDFDDVCAWLLQGGTWGNRVFLPRTIVCGANWQHTSQLILALNSGTTKKLVRASNCYPLLDFASESNEWFNAKVGESNPKISLSAFVTLMQYLDFAFIEDNELKIKKGVPKISLTLIRNNKAQKFTFNTTMARAYEGLDCKQVQEVFDETVTVSFLNTADWTKEAAFDARMKTIKALLDAYALGM